MNLLNLVPLEHFVKLLKILNFKTIPDVAGIYIFYRQTKSGEEEALYVGQSQNIRERFKQTTVTH